MLLLLVMVRLTALWKVRIKGVEKEHVFIDIGGGSSGGGDEVGGSVAGQPYRCVTVVERVDPRRGGRVVRNLGNKVAGNTLVPGGGVRRCRLLTDTLV